VSDRPHRLVFYFHGFDPAAPARYRRIFAAASERLGVAVADLGDGAEGWAALRGGVRSEIRYLRYEGLVRGFRAPVGGIPAAMLRGAGALAGYVRDGAAGRLARRAPRAFGLMLSPWITVLAVLLAAGAPAVFLGPWAILAIGLAAVAAPYLLRRIYLDIVIDLFAYMRVLARGEGPDWRAYAARVRQMAGSIAARGDLPGTGPGPSDGAPETLIVGHSLGGVAAILAVADLLEDWPADRPLGLLTLGSTHGIVLAQRGAGRDRLAGAIARLCADRRLFWVDVSAPRDAFAVPLTDPLLMIDAPDGARSPRVISAPLARAPTIPGDRRTVFAAMRRHMAYLLAPPEGAGFDYADTVTGAATLAERFRARRNSPKARMRAP